MAQFLLVLTKVNAYVSSRDLSEVFLFAVKN